MTATREFAAKLAHIAAIPVPPQVWELFILLATRAIMRCFDDTGEAAKWVREKRFSERRENARLARAWRVAGGPRIYRDRAVAAMTTYRDEFTQNRLAVFYLDTLEQSSYLDEVEVSAKRHSISPLTTKEIPVDPKTMTQMVLLQVLGLATLIFGRTPRFGAALAFITDLVMNRWDEIWAIGQKSAGATTAVAAISNAPADTNEDQLTAAIDANKKASGPQNQVLAAVETYRKATDQTP